MIRDDYVDHFFQLAANHQFLQFLAIVLTGQLVTAVTVQHHTPFVSQTRTEFIHLSVLIAKLSCCYSTPGHYTLCDFSVTATVMPPK